MIQSEPECLVHDGCCETTHYYDTPVIVARKRDATQVWHASTKVW